MKSAPIKPQPSSRRKAAGPAPDIDARRLVEELKIHQIELELQNEELKQSKSETEALLEQYTDLYDFAPVGYFNLSADGTIKLVNLAGASMFGAHRADIVGRPFDQLIAADFRPDFKRFLIAVFSDRTKHSGDFGIFNGDRESRTVNIEAKRLFNGLECRIVVVDITERKRSADRLQLLWEAARVLLATEDPDTMLRGLLARIGPALGVDTYFNYLVDDTGRALHLASYMGAPEKQAHSMAKLEFGEALCGTVARTHETCHATHIQKSTEPKARLVKSLGLRAYVCSPLLKGKLLLGTLAFASSTRDQFDAGELSMLQTITHYVAVAYERQQAALTLQASEARYRRLFEAAHDGVLLIDPATSKITDANPFMTKLLDYPYAYLVGKELYEIGLLKDEPASKAMFKKLKKEHAVRYDNLPLASRRGRRQQVEVVANLYKENGRPVIQCNIRDITERKRAEDILRRNEALFSALIQQAPVGVYVVDEKFCLMEINSSARHVFKNVQPLAGRDFTEIIRVLWPRKLADQILALFTHTLETGEPYRSPEFKGRRRDTGVQEIYDWQIQRINLPSGEFGVVCFFNDVTERIRNEQARRTLDILTASNAKLKKEIVRRQAVETALTSSERRALELLKQARQLQDKLRHLSHQILMVQEAERKKISRELHDDISQLLVGIIVHVANFTKAATINPASIRKNLTPLRLLVEKSVRVVHRFARELRPTMLDDLGLIPALQSYVDEFPKQRGRRIGFTAFEGAESLDNDRRTVLYRVAQESLVNISKHARATVVNVG
ncbi:MAG: PAS domain S-box protein, partial [Opitutaceae bacterium]|nr:PAS domain S-box protein [Opitutaceae bacterium]